MAQIHVKRVEVLGNVFCFVRKGEHLQEGPRSPNSAKPYQTEDTKLAAEKHCRSLGLNLGDVGYLMLDRDSSDYFSSREGGDYFVYTYATRA